jgi:hypothetical protein
MFTTFAARVRTLTLGLGALLAAACARSPSPDGDHTPAASKEAASTAANASEAGLLLGSGTGQPQKGTVALLPCPAHVPEALNPPGEATLALALPADGVQMYACTSAKPGEAPAWALEGPHALLGSAKAVSGIHYAGPIWQGLDGSSVKGAKVASADAPNPGAVPWLAMSGSAAAAAGSFAQVTFIQRLETVGGKAPAAGCDAGHLGAKVLVPYKANYYFYRSRGAGEAQRQCRSERAKTQKS